MLLLLLPLCRFFWCCCCFCYYYDIFVLCVCVFIFGVFVSFSLVCLFARLLTDWLARFARSNWFRVCFCFDDYFWSPYPHMRLHTFFTHRHEYPHQMYIIMPPNVKLKPTERTARVRSTTISYVCIRWAVCCSQQITNEIVCGCVLHSQFSIWKIKSSGFFIPFRR